MLTSELPIQTHEAQPHRTEDRHGQRGGAGDGWYGEVNHGQAQHKSEVCEVCMIIPAELVDFKLSISMVKSILILTSCNKVHGVPVIYTKEVSLF